MMGWLCLLWIAAWSQTDEELLRQWKAGQTVSEVAVEQYGIDRCFTVEPISQALLKRMSGKSYPKGCTIPAGQLRHVKVLHRRADGFIGIGELVCHSTIASKLKNIFRQLYDHCYPIQRMVLIDDYNANDEKSMSANNTSCFCFRKIAGSQKLSKHALGLAIDINPLYNPQVKGSSTASKRKSQGVRVLPKAGEPYADRSKTFKYKIERDDLCYRLFTENGFKWGGNWRTTKDYQHFEY